MAMVVMAERLRSDPGLKGLSTSVSGFLHKVGAGVWSTTPPPTSFAHRDVTDLCATSRIEVAADHVGRATVASWTVEHQRDGSMRAVAILDTAEGARTIASSSRAETCEQMASGDWGGASVAVNADGSLRP